MKLTNMKQTVQEPTIPGPVNHSVYIEALRIASQLNFAVDIMFTNLSDRTVWAVKDAKSEFWFESFLTQEAAQAFCDDFNWVVNDVNLG